MAESDVGHHGERLHGWLCPLLDTAICIAAICGVNWLRLNFQSSTVLVRDALGFATTASLAYLIVAHSLLRRWRRSHFIAGNGEQAAVVIGDDEMQLLERRSILIGILTAAFVIATAAARVHRLPPTIVATPLAQPKPAAITASRASVASYGAVGDGITDDTAAINAAIAANPGRVLHFHPGRIYQIRADVGAGADHGGGITLNRAGTTLSMYGATIRMNGTSMMHYQMIDVTAADCRVLGGRLIGDVTTHVGSAGEWGHGVSVGGGADRFAARDVYVTHCWGDGFFIWERPSDVSLTNCTGDNNRRQGLSVIDAIRPHVRGGEYINNGRTKYTSPGGGIDLEPDHGTARDVVEAVITGVTMAGNRGPGLWSSSNGRSLTATITDCRAIDNGVGGSDSGFLVDGLGNRTTFDSCQSDGNSQNGWTIGSLVVNARLKNCTAKLNGEHGIIDSGTGTQIIGRSNL